MCVHIGFVKINIKQKGTKWRNIYKIFFSANLPHEHANEEKKHEIKKTRYLYVKPMYVLRLCGNISDLPNIRIEKVIFFLFIFLWIEKSRASNIKSARLTFSCIFSL